MNHATSRSKSNWTAPVSYLILYLIRLTKVGGENHRDKTSHETTAVGGEDQRHALIMGNVNRVLDHRVCIPISLSMVYLLIRQRLILPLYGIGMPEHFLVTWEPDRYWTPDTLMRLALESTSPMCVIAQGLLVLHSSREWSPDR